MNKVFSLLLTVALSACGSTEGSGQAGLAAFEDLELETYELAVFPDVSTIPELLERPEDRFVMLNMLVYKDEASGPAFEGLSGAEAYAIYVDGLWDAQLAIGSRLIWSGSVQAQVVGVSEPSFEDIALLEYASPTAFLDFAEEPGDAPEARSAGLLGQWLVASTTRAEHDVAQSAPSEPLPSAAEVARRTGLTEAQAERLLDGPADEVVFIVDLLRFSDGSGDAYEPYEDALAKAGYARAATLVWMGSADTQVMGKAEPAFHEIVVRSYPNRAAYIDTLSDPAVLEASSARIEGLSAHWMYTAAGTGGGVGSLYRVCTLGLCMEEPALGSSCLEIYDACVAKGHYPRSCRMDADMTCGVFGQTGAY